MDKFTAEVSIPMFLSSPLANGLIVKLFLGQLMTPLPCSLAPIIVGPISTPPKP